MIEMDYEEPRVFRLFKCGNCGEKHSKWVTEDDKLNNFFYSTCCYWKITIDARKEEMIRRGLYG